MLLEFKIKTLFLRRTFNVRIHDHETVFDLKNKALSLIKEGGFFNFYTLPSRIEDLGLMAKILAIKEDSTSLREVYVRGVPLPKVRTIYIYSKGSWIFLIAELFLGFLSSLVH